MSWTISSLLKCTTEYLEKKNVSSSRSSSEILLAKVLNCRRVDLYVKYNDVVSDEALRSYRQLIQRRSQNEPVAYIMGQREFWSLDFEVGPGVLIPRPETETIIEQVQKIYKQEDSFQCFELGTGSGAISVALAKEFPNVQIVASDVSEVALAYAKKNASKHEVNIEFRYGSGLNVLKEGEKFHLFISNPPYVSNDQFANLSVEVKAYEPELALKGGKEGVDLHREVLNKASQHLYQGGSVFLELDPSQSVLLKTEFQNKGIFAEVSLISDYSGKERVLKAVYG